MSLILNASAVAAAQKLKSVIILDNSVYAPTELFTVYRSYLGKSVSAPIAIAIAEAVQQKYAADGFARPGYRIEDQGVKSGIIRVRVVETRISSVRFSGDSGPYQQRLAARFSELTTSASLRTQDVTRLVKWARRLPGLQLNVATVADPAQVGTYVMEVDTEYQPMEGQVRMSNRGTEEIGRNLFFASATANGVFGASNSMGLFFASARHTNNYLGGGVYYRQVVGPADTAVNIRVSDTAMQYTSSGVVLQQKRNLYMVQVSQPLPSRSNNEYSMSVGLEFDDLDVLQDGGISREDRLRSVVSGFTAKWRGDNSVSLATLELELGINGLNSRLNDFTNPDDPRNKNYSIAMARYVQVVTLTENWSIRWDAYGQRSPNILPSIKQFKVGGNRIGRGFEAAAVSGDSGVGNKLELSRNVSIGVLTDLSAKTYAYYDLGSVWRNVEPGRESAASAGLGLSMHNDRFTGYLEIAKPLTHADADGQKDLGAFFELAVSFW